MAYATDKAYSPDASTEHAYIPEYDDDRRGSVTEPRVGELQPGEAEAGGLGRHLGLWSTIFLM